MLTKLGIKMYTKCVQNFLSVVILYLRSVTTMTAKVSIKEIHDVCYLQPDTSFSK